MIQCKNRYVYVLWLFLAAGLSIGWQSEEAGMNISRLTENIGQKVEAMCVMEENNLLFRQDIDATSLIERQQNEQRDAQERQRLQILEEKMKRVQKQKAKKRKGRKVFLLLQGHTTAGKFFFVSWRQKRVTRTSEAGD